MRWESIICPSQILCPFRFDCSQSLGFLCGLPFLLYQCFLTDGLFSAGKVGKTISSIVFSCGRVKLADEFYLSVTNELIFPHTGI